MEIPHAPGELAAIAGALDALRPGELLVVLHDAIEASLAFVKHYLADAGRSPRGASRCRACRPSPKASDSSPPRPSRARSARTQ